MKGAGRAIGLMLLVQALLAPAVYFRWLPPLTGREFLANAADSELQVRIALLLTFVLSAMTVGSALAALPIVRRHSERMAFGFLALALVGFAALAMENVVLRGMLALSLEQARAGTTPESLQGLSAAIRPTWIGAHYTNLTIGHLTMFLFNLILFRFAFVPRVISSAGMATTLVAAAVVAMPLLGTPARLQLVLPMGLVQLTLVLWLIARGFRDQQEPARERQLAVSLA
jgi:hypothetical protein